MGLWGGEKVVVWVCQYVLQLLYGAVCGWESRCVILRDSVSVVEYLCGVSTMEVLGWYHIVDSLGYVLWSCSVVEDGYIVVCYCCMVQ